MNLKELLKARDNVAELLATLDPLSKAFSVHYKTWRTFDEAIAKKLEQMKRT